MVVRVMPVEIRDALLQPEKIVDSTDDDVDSCRVASLCPEVVLEVGIVTLA